MSKAIQGAIGAAEIAGGAALLMTGVGAPFGGMLLSMGITAEAGVIASALGSKSGLAVTTRTPAQPRQIIRGVQRVGGTIVYCSTTGHSKRQYNLVIALATHPCQGIENLYLDGRQVFWDTGSSYNQTVNGLNFGGNADGNNHDGPNGTQYNFGGLVFCAAFCGRQNTDPTVIDGAWVGPRVWNSGDPAYPGFCSALQANDPTWSPSTEAGQTLTPYLAGCTYVYLKIEADAGAFPQFPEIRFTVHGKCDVLDPRAGTPYSASVMAPPGWNASGGNAGPTNGYSASSTNTSCAIGIGGYYPPFNLYESAQAEVEWRAFAWPELPPGAVVTSIEPVITYELAHSGTDADAVGLFPTLPNTSSFPETFNTSGTWVGASIGTAQSDLEDWSAIFQLACTMREANYGASLVVSSIGLRVNYNAVTQATRGFSSNWALQVADVLSDPTWGLGDGAVNQAQLIAAANVCDEQVACQATSLTSWEPNTNYTVGQQFYAAGDAWQVTSNYVSGDAWGDDDLGHVTAIADATTTEARYSLHMHYDCSTGPGDVLDQMMPAAAGRLSRIGGEWFIWPACWQGPSFSFDEGVLLDKIQWEGKKSLGELCNRITGTYTAPNYPYNTAGDLYDSNGFWQGQTQNNFPFSFQPTNYPMYALDELHGYDEDVYLDADTPNQGPYDAYAAYAAGAVILFNGVPWEANEAVPAGAAPGTIDEDGNPYWSPTGNYLPREVQQNCLLSIAQAQRCAKIILLRCRQQGSGTLVMSVAAYAMQPLDVMQFTSPTFGWTSKLLEVAGLPGQEFKLRLAEPPNSGGGDATPALFVEVPVNETDPSVYEWDPETEELTPYATPAFGGGVSVWIVGAPSDLAALSDLTTALVQPDGSIVPRIELLWTADSDSYVTNGGSIRIQIAAHGSGYWQDVLLLNGQATQAFLGNVVSGQVYDVRIAGVRPNGAQSAWVEVDNIAAGPPLPSPSHEEILTDGDGNIVFAAGDVIYVDGVPD